MKLAYRLLPCVACALALMPMLPAQTTLEARRRALNDLLHEQWEYNLKNQPEFASVIGDKRYNDQLSDISAAAIRRREAESKVWLTRFQAIDTTGFPDQEALNKRLMVRDLSQGIEGEKFKGWEMPIDQFNGIHIQAAQLPLVLQFDTVKDYRDYIARLRKLPTVFDQTIANMRLGMADGLMPPKFLLEKVTDQIGKLAAIPVAESPFAGPLAKFPDSISKDDQASIGKDMLAAIQNDLVPSYRKLLAFVRDEYAPKGRTEFGVWSLPDGPSRYAFAVKQSTTTDMTPSEIHQLGLQQVAEIEAAELVLAKKLGFEDLKSFRASINGNPKLHVHSADEIVDLYRKYIDQMYGKLPELFTRFPKAHVTVAKIEPYREKESSTAYQQGTPDGSRPGRVEVNTYDWANQNTTEVESTAYHEGIPGHHMQISIAQELTSLPPFRQQEYYTAYTEGWALYTERLGKEVGFYQDPYSDYGRLEGEMLRAIRLVVDTGLHDKKWTRQQVVDFFHAHSNIGEALVQSETDRYIAWPSQALGYKIGQLTILRLREHAKTELGAKFDIRRFHDEVLSAGALPMDILGERIDAFIASEKASGTGAPTTLHP